MVQKERVHWSEFPFLFEEKRGMSNWPVFYDPANRRWRFIKAGIIVVFSFLIALFSLFAINLYSYSFQSVSTKEGRFAQSISQTNRGYSFLIAELSARGYPIEVFSGTSLPIRASASPLAQETRFWQHAINELSLHLLCLSLALIALLLLICLVYSVIQIILLFTLVGYQKFKTRSLVYAYQPQYSVAVLIPAYNEGKVILRTVDLLLASTHPTVFEIIVVDDGSSDNTWTLLQSHYQDNKLVHLIQQPNQGKSAALNNAISHTKADIVVTIDADTIVSKMTIMELTSQFIDEHVGAVAGNIKVGNRTNWLTKMQAVEYITNHNLLRRAFSVLNALMIVAGATGAWRRDLVVRLGGFPENTLAEDEDLTLTIRKSGYAIRFADKAITYTEAPDTIKPYIKQRYRWTFGGFQALWKHKDMLFRRRYGWLGCLIFPSTLIGMLLIPIIGPLMDILFLLVLGVLVFNQMTHPSGELFVHLMTVSIYYVLFISIDFVLGCMSFFLERGEDKTLLLWLIPQRLFSRWALFYTTIKALHAALKGHAVGWNKFNRTATVTTTCLDE